MCVCLCLFLSPPSRLVVLLVVTSSELVAVQLVLVVEGVVVVVVRKIAASLSFMNMMISFSTASTIERSFRFANAERSNGCTAPLGPLEVDGGGDTGGGGGLDPLPEPPRLLLLPLLELIDKGRRPK